jgi:hypothetical protein
MKSTCFRWVSLAVVVLALVGAGSRLEAKSLDKATASFCTDLASYAKAVNNLYNLGANNTVADYNNAQKAVDTPYNKLAKASDKLSKSQNDALNKTAKQLSDAVNSIPKKATLAEANDVVDDASAAALAAYVDISTTICTYDSE